MDSAPAGEAAARNANPRSGRATGGQQSCCQNTGHVIEAALCHRKRARSPSAIRARSLSRGSSRSIHSTSARGVIDHFDGAVAHAEDALDDVLFGGFRIRRPACLVQQDHYFFFVFWFFFVVFDTPGRSLKSVEMESKWSGGGDGIEVKSASIRPGSSPTAPGFVGQSAWGSIRDDEGKVKVRTSMAIS